MPNEGINGRHPLDIHLLLQPEKTFQHQGHHLMSRLFFVSEKKTFVSFVNFVVEKQSFRGRK